MRLGQLGTGLLRRSPAQPLASWINRRALVSLAYHSVLSSRSFSQQVEYLVSRFHPVSLAEVINAACAKSELPACAVLVTFDDGDRTVVENALPVMRRHGVPGVIFVTAGYVDSNEPFWWDEAEELVSLGGRVEGWPEMKGDSVVRRLRREVQQSRLAALDELRRTATASADRTIRGLTAEDVRMLDADGIAVQNHTLTHPSLDRCDPETIKKEIVQAHSRLEGILGREPVAFAYPGGYYADQARAVLESLGYRAAFLFDHRLNPQPISDPLRISRVRIDADAPIDRLAIILSGLHPALLHAMGRA
ncbi:MAG: polysaccharide deacetylase family protein [Coriobacteriia bacterium]|nr:polysaccharide deacetylase family protein [Coriobacteriia bacterium]